MSWVAVAIAVVGAGTAAYSSDQSRKGLHAQQSALKDAQEADARQAAEAETSAQVAANAKLADTKRRRRSSSLLASGDTGGAETLGGAPSVLANGGPSARASFASSTASPYGGSVLGSGSGSSGRATRPTTPSRASAI